MNIYLVNSKELYYFIILLFFLIYINNFVFCNIIFFIKYILNFFYVFLCFFLFKLTRLGKKIFLYFLKSKLEVSKIIWPSNYEIFSTVLVVFFLSFLISIIIWVFDNFLLYLISIFLSLRIN